MLAPPDGWGWADSPLYRRQVDISNALRGGRAVMPMFYFELSELLGRVPGDLVAFGVGDVPDTIRSWGFGCLRPPLVVVWRHGP